jgi:hypothetical protein
MRRTFVVAMLVGFVLAMFVAFGGRLTAPNAPPPPPPAPSNK